MAAARQSGSGAPEAARTIVAELCAPRPQGRDIMYKGIKNIHFVGIGGIGMSGIAELLLNLGYHVAARTCARSDITAAWPRSGRASSRGTPRRTSAGAEVVVTSSAVRADNVEVAEARALGVPVIPRAEMLAELMRLKYGIAVAGATARRRRPRWWPRCSPRRPRPHGGGRGQVK